MEHDAADFPLYFDVAVAATSIPMTEPRLVPLLLPLQVLMMRLSHFATVITNAPGST